MAQINTIIFDLGGVLIDWNPQYVYRKMLPDPEERQFFLKHVCTHDWNLEQDAGRSLKEATETKVAEFPEWETEIRAFYGRWPDMLGGAIDGTVKILKELIDHPKYRVYALTNWSNETFPIALKTFDFLHLFEGILVSGDEKTRKPYPDIYEIFLKRYKVAPSEAVFIDDSLPNVHAAEALGIKAIHFQSAKKLRETLEELEILT